MILLQSSAPDVKFRHVQTGGGAKEFPALVGGHIDVGTQTTLEIVNNGVGADGKLAAASQDVQDLYESKGFLPTFLRGQEFSDYLTKMWGTREEPLANIELNK